MGERKDIFDRITDLGFLRPFRPLYVKYREALLYLFFGGLTSFLSIGLFWVFTSVFKMNALWANAVDWCICVAFAYLTNRTWVFKDKAHGVSGIARECGKFVAGRVSTLFLEEAVLWLGIDLLKMNTMVVKITAQVLVIVGNYVISKCFVFRKST